MQGDEILTRSGACLPVEHVGKVWTEDVGGLYVIRANVWGQTAGLLPFYCGGYFSRECRDAHFEAMVTFLARHRRDVMEARGSR